MTTDDQRAALSDAEVELAGALEREWALKVVRDVAGVAPALSRPFRSGFEAACEEIATRLNGGGEPAQQPRDEPSQTPADLARVIRDLNIQGHERVLVGDEQADLLSVKELMEMIGEVL